MRLFVDTNVIISGLYKSSTPPGQILEAHRSTVVQLVVCDLVLNEVTGVFARKLHALSPLFAEFIASTPPEIVADASLEAASPWTDILPTKDAIIYASACAAGVDYFVTGNSRDFGILPAERMPVKVLSPGEVLESVKSESP